MHTYWEVSYSANTEAQRQTIFPTVIEAIKEIHKLKMVGIFAEIKPLNVSFAEPEHTLEMEDNNAED